MQLREGPGLRLALGAVWVPELGLHFRNIFIFPITSKCKLCPCNVWGQSCSGWVPLQWGSGCSLPWDVLCSAPLPSQPPPNPTWVSSPGDTVPWELLCFILHVGKRSCSMWHPLICSPGPRTAPFAS